MHRARLKGTGRAAVEGNRRSIFPTLVTPFFVGFFASQVGPSLSLSLSPRFFSTAFRGPNLYNRLTSMLRSPFKLSGITHVAQRSPLNMLLPVPPPSYRSTNRSKFSISFIPLVMLREVRKF